MAKMSKTSKKEQTAKALGWADQLGGDSAQNSKAKSEGRLQRKTYLMTDELIQRLDIMAKANNVGVNELVRFLVKYGLDGLDAGTYTLPVRAITHYTLDV